MSDTPPDQDTAAPAANQPVLAPLNIVGQYIKDMSFEVPGAPDIFNALRQQSPAIQVALDANVRQITGPLFEVVMNVQLEAKVGDKVAFIMELVYGTLAELNPQAVPEEHAHPVLLIEVPRLMFPFVRHIVSTTIATAGFPPVMLQIVDFADMYRKKFAEQGSPDAPADTTPAVH